MDKKKIAVLIALQAHPEGLLRADLREATKREVSSHTVQEEQLDPLLAAAYITATPEPSTDGRVKGMVDRFRLAPAGREFLSSQAHA